MWLSDRRVFRMSVASALSAIDIWQYEPVEQRSLGDEALPHIYLTTARLKLGEIEGRLETVHPIMSLPKDRQISWIRARVGVNIQLDGCE
jgi:hypothetical protein